MSSYVQCRVPESGCSKSESTVSIACSCGRLVKLKIGGDKQICEVWCDGWGMMCWLRYDVLAEVWCVGWGMMWWLRYDVLAEVWCVGWGMMCWWGMIWWLRFDGVNVLWILNVRIATLTNVTQETQESQRDSTTETENKVGQVTPGQRPDTLSFWLFYIGSASYWLSSRGYIRLWYFWLAWHRVKLQVNEYCLPGNNAIYLTK